MTERKTDMNRTQLLKEEIRKPLNGLFSPVFFYAEGLKQLPEDTKVPDRITAGIASMFRGVRPHIYKEDLILGSLRCADAAISKEEADRANEVYNALPHRNFWTGSDHFAGDYWMILEEGIPGIRRMIKNSKEAHINEPDRVLFLSRMETVWNAFADMIANYASCARSLVGAEGYDTENLLNMAQICESLLTRAPASFREALQLLWMCQQAFYLEGRYAMAFGRIDQYLYPYYKKDIDSGILTDETATELIENAFIKIHEFRTMFGCDDVSNICIGGSDRDGKHTVNGLSYCVLHAVGNCNVPGPNLSARICADTPDRFLDECLQVVGTGLGYPALMNDGAILPALRRYGYDEEDVLNFCMVGCIENFLSGKQRPWTDGRYDTPRCIEYVLKDGKGALGTDTGAVEDITTMDDFLKKLKIHLSAFVKEYVINTCKGMTVEDPEDNISPFLSLFERECIERGKDINNGGTKYPINHGAALMGVGTFADSLAAIEKVIFIEKKYTLKELSAALSANFEGYEEMRTELLNAPKYGNNDDFVDKYAVFFLEFLSHEFDQYKTPDGGNFFVLMAANTSNIWAGMSLGATPDGRRSGEPLSDAASPTYGMDHCGCTSTVLSVSKPDYTLAAGGTVVNQKFMPSVFEDGKRQKLASLIRIYFSRGGMEMQINSTSPEILRDAIDHPDNYRDLVVRVSGFSAYYVTLGIDVQHDILRRTQQAV